MLIASSVRKRKRSEAEDKIRSLLCPSLLCLLGKQTCRHVAYSFQEGCDIFHRHQRLNAVSKIAHVANLLLQFARLLVDQKVGDVACRLAYNHISRCKQHGRIHTALQCHSLPLVLILVQPFAYARLCQYNVHSPVKADNVVLAVAQQLNSIMSTLCKHHYWHFLRVIILRQL